MIGSDSSWATTNTFARASKNGHHNRSASSQFCACASGFSGLNVVNGLPKLHLCGDPSSVCALKWKTFVIVVFALMCVIQVYCHRDRRNHKAERALQPHAISERTLWLAHTKIEQNNKHSSPPSVCVRLANELAGEQSKLRLKLHSITYGTSGGCMVFRVC